VLDLGRGILVIVKKVFAGAKDSHSARPDRRDKSRLQACSSVEPRKPDCDDFCGAERKFPQWLSRLIDRDVESLAKSGI
jgi:hypothetical protein